MGLGQQAGHSVAQLFAQLALALFELILVLQRRNALTAGFQLHQFVVGLRQALGGQALVFLQGFELAGELLLFLLGGQVALLVVLPAWLIGFATPVFAWWSITSRHFGIHIARRDAEWMLAAGMLSTVPAIVINSVVSPILIGFFGLDPFTTGTLGEGLILFVSAPVGEEISKAIAVLALSHLIISPKHGFYVGSTVGLGFALLENASYISMALAGDYSSISYFFTATLRGLSSIPGHAMWTGLEDCRF